MYAKNLCKQTVLVQFIIKKRGHMFFGTQCSFSIHCTKRRGNIPTGTSPNGGRRMQVGRQKS